MPRRPSWLLRLSKEELNLADFNPGKVRELRALMLDWTSQLFSKDGHDDPLYTQSLCHGLASQIIPLSRKLARKASP